jgi:hypothetical protein
MDSLLERYAVVVMADHGQTGVRAAVSLGEVYAGVEGILPLASNRAAHVYLRPGCRLDPREVASRLDSIPAAETTLFREGDGAVARREGEELAFAPDGEGGFSLSGDASILGYPDALARAWAALANPNTGEVLVSAAEGYEFVDLGGAHHVGGGSHGSLVAGDTEVPLLTVGIEGTADSIVGVAPLVLSHFGVSAPAYTVGRAA